MYVINLLIVLVVLLPSMAFGSISFTDGLWSTTFNYVECAQRGGGGATDCATVAKDDIYWSWGAKSLGENYTSVVSSANYEGGTGGNGARFWVGDGDDVNSGDIRIDFPTPQTELWIRFYMRYQAGFKWLNDKISYNKMIYLRTAGGNGGIAAIPSFMRDRTYINSQGVWPEYNSEQVSASGYGWDGLHGGTVSDGSWHCFEFYLKMDTGGSTGQGKIWIDGVLRGSNTTMNWSGGDSTAQEGWTYFEFNSNQYWPDNGQYMYVDYDDIAISTSGYVGPVSGGVTATCSDGMQNGDETGVDCGGECTSCESEGFPTGVPTKGTQLLSESFEDNNWTSRGWYDGTNSQGATSDGYSGNALKWTWTSSATQPTGFSTIRRKLTIPVDEFLIEYYMKFDAGWQGSGRAYHPHLVHLLSSDATDYQSTNTSNSDLYFEVLADTSNQYDNYVQIAHQDKLRVNTSYGTPPQNLTSVTEDRSANHCNTTAGSSGSEQGICYSDGGGYYSANVWKTTKPLANNTWVKIQTYIKKNTFTNDVANFDGIIRVWADGKLILDKTGVLLAANTYADTEWEQLVLAPWIGDGSPVTQSMWIDELSVWTIGLGQSLLPPAKLHPPE